ncbi:MAG: hypothetical protein GTO63_18055 [Anaerolineae bacterium]|nr:hypothetical protein [Anaerolineae bacterium]NIN98698.1 hypothetical protein [Anaerolineae bacterium]NIQ81588.1 hypothetical protein [Anaerolineae bacterium]
MGKFGTLAKWSTGILLAVVLAFAVAGFVYHAGKIILFPYELAAGEELLLRDAVQLARAERIYTDVNDFPFIVSNYPPLFVGLSALLIPLLGQSLASTRLVSTVCTLLTAALIGLIIFQESRRTVPSVTCGAAFLGSIFVYHWGAWGRVDTTALLFSLLAILVFLHSPDWRGTCLAACFCVLSLYTKQTQWAAPMAIFLWLLWCRKWRHALLFFVVLGGLGVGASYSLTWVTDGQFYHHLVTYNLLDYSLRSFASYWRAFLLTHGLIVAVALLWSLACLRKGSLSLPILYFATSALMTMAVGRAGASSNYFLELIAVTLILCGVLWSELEKRGTYAALAVPAILLLQLVWFKAFPLTPLATYYDPLPSFGYTPQAADWLAGQKIDQYVRNAEGEILTEGGGFALRNGKELYGSPWLLNALEGTGLVDRGLDGLERALAEHRFSLVILTWQSYPPRILEAVWANYQRIDTVDCVFRYEIFVPRDGG